MEQQYLRSLGSLDASFRPPRAVCALLALPRGIAGAKAKQARLKGAAERGGATTSPLWTPVIGARAAGRQQERPVRGYVEAVGAQRTTKNEELMWLGCGA
jgi:hypothetical protein